MKNSLDYCYFCNKDLYYRGHSKHQAEREIKIRNPFNNNDIQRLYVHFKCWKAALNLIKTAYNICSINKKKGTNNDNNNNR